MASKLYITFEQVALGQDQGHRHLLADKFAPELLVPQFEI
jgi:hypothetical protein